MTALTVRVSTKQFAKTTFSGIVLRGSRGRGRVTMLVMAEVAGGSSARLMLAVSGDRSPGKLELHHNQQDKDHEAAHRARFYAMRHGLNWKP